MIAEQPPDLAYRRLYYYLLKVVDQAIGRILDALDGSGMADDTIVVFTSDHGDLLGAHGGLVQKWGNAFDEATRVPLLVHGPGRAPRPRRDHRADQPRRPDPHVDGPGRHRRRAGRRGGGASTTPRSARCPVAT